MEETLALFERNLKRSLVSYKTYESAEDHVIDDYKQSFINIHIAKLFTAYSATSVKKLPLADKLPVFKAMPVEHRSDYYLFASANTWEFFILHEKNFFVLWQLTQRRELSFDIYYYHPGMIEAKPFLYFSRILFANDDTSSKMVKEYRQWKSLAV